VGQTETILVTVRNVGEATVYTSPCPAQVYVNGVPLSFACIEIALDLPPGETIVQETPWTPDTSGQKTVTAQVRYGGDSNRANDTKKLSVAVTEADPVTDIAVTGVRLYPEMNYYPPPPGPIPAVTDASSNDRQEAPTVEGTAVVGQSARVEIRVENQGNQRVRLQNPEDVSVTVDGTPLEYAAFYPIDLQPGYSTYVSFRWTPADAGEVDLVASVKTLNDGTYVPGEADIEDNTLSASVVVESPVRDIAVNSISVFAGGPIYYLDAPNGAAGAGGRPSTQPPTDQLPVPIPPPLPAVGEPAQIMVFLENQGNVWERDIQINLTVNGEPLGATVAGTQLVQCLPLAGADVSAGCVMPPYFFGLLPGSVQAYYFNWTPPALGSYVIAATATPVEDEVDTEDNAGSLTVEITEERVHDMSLDAMQLDELELSPGSTVRVALTLTNRGTIREDNVYVDVRVNNRPYIYQRVGSLNAGETKLVQLAGRIPRGARAGSYILNAMIPAVYAETNLDNNRQELTIVVGPGGGTPGAPPKPDRPR